MREKGSWLMDDKKFREMERLSRKENLQKVLKEVKKHANGISRKKLAEISGYSSNTLYAYLNCLCESGLVEKRYIHEEDKPTGLYVYFPSGSSVPPKSQKKGILSTVKSIFAGKNSSKKSSKLEDLKKAVENVGLENQDVQDVVDFVQYKLWRKTNDKDFI